MVPSIDQPKYANAGIQFFKPPPGDDGPYLDILKPDGTFQRNYTTEEKPVFIENLRVGGRDKAVTLDVEGFQLFSDCPTAFQAFGDEQEIARGYYPESIEITKKFTGASQVIIIDHNLRRRRIGDDPYAPGQPSRRVHVDFSASQAHILLRKLSPQSEAPRRFQILSFWRPISQPAYDSPLVLGDYTTTNMQEDMVRMMTIRPKEEVEVIAVNYNKDQKWGYFYGVTPDEVVMIKSYDSDDSVAFCCPHTSFEDPSTPKGSPPRESIELRLLVLYE